MTRCVWKAYVKESDIDEYKKRHDKIWPEMTKLLNDAGVHNYSIWFADNEVFGYFECDIDIDESLRIQSESEVHQRWNKYMDDILRFDERGPIFYKQVFMHK